LDELIIEKGLNSNFLDFEDSLQYFSALRTECDIIITRNGKDFKKSQLPIMTPDEFLNSIKE
jgi:predicted nucleic acid-binding protein